jgi:hypothetical protein
VTQAHKLAIWLLLAVLAVAISFVAFRGYLGAEFLIDFANTFVC